MFKYNYAYVMPGTKSFTSNISVGAFELTNEGQGAKDSVDVDGCGLNRFNRLNSLTLATRNIKIA